MDTIAERLLAGLEKITVLMSELLDASTINWVSDRADRYANETGILMTGMSDGRWGPTNDRQAQLQRELLNKWNSWIEQTRLLFSQDTISRQKEIEKSAHFVSSWIQRNGNQFSIPRTTSEAKNVFQKKVEPLSKTLRSLGAGEGVVVVPDTNVLLRSPDLAKYESVLKTNKFIVFLVPSVLRELDSHKVNHKNPDVREKARKFSDRIKGWRNQGDLSAGVKVQGNVYVRVEGREPDFKKTLSWLHADIEDDRIIASILEAQRRCPTDRIVLLTGDSVMLAKADAANVPTEDTPEPDL